LIRAVETGMTIEQFWSSTWKEFQIYVLAYERRELQEMRRTRAIAHMIYSANSDKPMSVEKFWPLHGDPKEPERVPIDPKEYGRIFDMYK
jgi:hypothetical protein